MNIGIIGLGGTGQWVASLLSKTVKQDDRLDFIDKDKFERKNMDRQLNCRVGTNKAKATAVALGRTTLVTIRYIKSWFPIPKDLGDAEDIDVMFCCADNHAAAQERCSKARPS